MIARIQNNQELSVSDAIQQALQERDECQSHFESLYQLALSRSAVALHHIAALEFKSLEKQWRRDPSHCRDFFAANHLGAEKLLSVWTSLKNHLEEESLIPSFDLILDCVRADASPVGIQSIDDNGLMLVCRFLVMHESPESVLASWLKISKCVDSDHFRRRFEEFVAAGYDAISCRQAMLELARAKSAEWQKIANLSQQQFEELFKTLQHSIIPACRVDRTLGAALRDAETRLNRVEARYQKLLKEQFKKDLKKNQKAATDQQPDSSPEPQNLPDEHQQNLAVVQNPQPNSTLVQKHLADYLAAKDRHTKATERLCELLEVTELDPSLDSYITDDDDLVDEDLEDDDNEGDYEGDDIER